MGQPDTAPPRLRPAAGRTPSSLRRSHCLRPGRRSRRSIEGVSVSSWRASSLGTAFCSRRRGLLTEQALTPSQGSGLGSTRHAQPLRRQALVSVRQSPPQQVAENVEATARQDGLVERAIAWGWSPERVIVLEEDQGQSGQSMATRWGLQRWLAEGRWAQVGLILGLALSRWARSHTDWPPRLARCALCGTVVADADGL